MVLGSQMVSQFWESQIEEFVDICGTSTKPKKPDAVTDATTSVREMV